MHTDFDRCYRAVQSKDARFDGWFVTAVLTTKIYCRPSCPVRPPYARNMRFYPTAAAAQRAGFRACKRCRPDASPGSPEWNVRGDVVARAMRLIADGTVDRDGVGGLAARLGYTVRQLERLMQAEVGATPLTLARAQRAQMARVLIETTDMPFSDVAFAAGFSSIRQFNDTVRSVCDLTPTMLRARARTRFGRGDVTGTGVMSLRLPVRAPFAYDGIFGHLAASAVRGVEEVRDGTFRRTLRLPRGNGIVSLTPYPDHVRCRLVVDDFRDLSAAIARSRRLLDLDADPEAVVDALSADPHLTELVAKAPGQRIPRCVDEHELALRVVLGQQVSLAAARTHAGRIAAAYGPTIEDPEGGLTHVFPAVEQLCDIDPRHLAFPKSRQRTLVGLIAALTDGRVVLDSGCDWEAARRDLLALPGIGPWTTEMIAMRGLGDPDAFPGTDLGICAAAEQLGLPSAPRLLEAHSSGWRPWRSYATQHLWTALDHSVNQWPPKET
ncbi:AraC family transcriptional regulator of adaptative response / DNA-3-methyladenine glycosylase II [Mycolicibacterium iranicum]|uniref:DNA-3-methyladenine glycosylase II n=1 Tax=Mycolicibacterium iranicum TaxID=912594 RepID=A0A839QID2_MYCIR|nr:DNA-3-methyladenine glycosylase 2 family protein [Mycolicibacterium iranicum]MBB2993796.1 AraC family transcriptional regulator of adaptative response / DNA-3-methyladenine glycosylase II [Mycolicibacterium iranicum]